MFQLSDISTLRSLQAPAWAVTLMTLLVSAQFLCRVGAFFFLRLASIMGRRKSRRAAKVGKVADRIGTELLMLGSNQSEDYFRKRFETRKRK